MTVVCRRTRSKLTRMAEKASLEVFARNLRNMLLSAPLRDAAVMGMDPGFKNGCKIAVVAADGAVLHTCVIYPDFRRGGQVLTFKDSETMRESVRKHSVTVLAIGNGTACRETEQMVVEMIEKGKFGSSKVAYTIVNEQGASIYRYPIHEV